MQRFLLDTHVFLWCLNNSPSLNEQAKATITDGKNHVYISAATTWEISIKKALGKLEAPNDLDSIVEKKRFSKLPISLYHGELAGQLPPIHRDPFDRMLVAQAQSEGLILVTGDPNIIKYDVQTLNAKNKLKPTDTKQKISNNKTKKVYTYSEARQKLSAVLDIAKTEEVIIKRRGGESFKIVFSKPPKSPFDVAGVKTKATTKDINDAVKESRTRENFESK